MKLSFSRARMGELSRTVSRRVRPEPGIQRKADSSLQWLPSWLLPWFTPLLELLQQLVSSPSLAYCLISPLLAVFHCLLLPVCAAGREGSPEQTPSAWKTTQGAEQAYHGSWLVWCILERIRHCTSTLSASCFSYWAEQIRLKIPAPLPPITPAQCGMQIIGHVGEWLHIRTFSIPPLALASSVQVLATKQKAVSILIHRCSLYPSRLRGEEKDQMHSLPSTKSFELVCWSRTYLK